MDESRRSNQDGQVRMSQDGRIRTDRLGWTSQDGRPRRMGKDGQDGRATMAGEDRQAKMDWGATDGSGRIHTGVVRADKSKWIGEDRCAKADWSRQTCQEGEEERVKIVAALRNLLLLDRGSLKRGGRPVRRGRVRGKGAKSAVLGL
eukprot:355584-Chlamydomonas_euryale.AAC.1